VAGVFVVIFLVAGVEVRISFLFDQLESLNGKLQIDFAAQAVALRKVVLRV
jgi:hypothetical protein